jgi:hypothetical protein
MGDKSPKSKQREKGQKDAAKATNKAGAATKQAAFSTPKDAKKK